LEAPSQDKAAVSAAIKRVHPPLAKLMARRRISLEEAGGGASEKLLDFLHHPTLSAMTVQENANFR
jgi:hypothetical protein